MNRRQFINAALYGAATAALPVSFAHLDAIASSIGSKRELRVVRRIIEIKGRAAEVFGLVQPNGTPGLSLEAQEIFDVSLRNETTEPTIVHWHGLTPPWNQDGVGDAPVPLLEPRADRKFSFPVGQAGTHWMHAHTLQEQALLAAPLIVSDPNDRGRDEQEVVILLHDFSFSPPEELLARLKGGTAHGSAGAMDHSSTGHGASVPQRSSGPIMPGMDVNDIEYDAYLANDRTFDDPQVVKVEPGGRIRLRVINGATATAFTVDIGSLAGTLIAVDGQDIVAVRGRRFPIAMGQRLDIRFDIPRTNEAFPILALREGAREQTGIVLAPTNTIIKKLGSVAQSAGPTVDLALEQTLQAAKPLVSRLPDMRFNMGLVGSMQSYAWGLEIRPAMVVRKDDRVEVTMVNSSMMAHPMHLHGHHFQVVAIDGRRFSGAVRDTVHIPPNRSVTIAFDAANPGEWAFHCHHLYHMATGMMSTLKYKS